MQPGKQEFYSVVGNLSGILAPGESESIHVAFDTTGIQKGAYRDTMTFSGVGPSCSSIGIPITWSVFSHGVIRVPDHISSIGQAVDLAVTGDSVLVADGTYTGDMNRDIEIYGKSISLISENGCKKTIIDCEYSGRGIKINTYGEYDGLIDGFQVVHGRAVEGGGFYCVPMNDCTIKNCSFYRNHAILGGGLFLYWGTGKVILGSCVSETNFAYQGGGFHLLDDNIDFGRNSIACNIAVLGGGIYFGHPHSTSLHNCIIFGNEALSEGGGLYCYESDSLNCINSIIRGNENEQICLDEESELVVAWSNIEDGWPGEGNIDENPRFMAPYEGNFHLKSNSPCIDTGDPTFEVPPGGGSRIDMGAFEYWQGWNILEKQESH